MKTTKSCNLRVLFLKHKYFMPTKAQPIETSSVLPGTILIHVIGDAQKNREVGLSR